MYYEYYYYSFFSGVDAREREDCGKVVWVPTMTDIEYGLAWCVCVWCVYDDSTVTDKHCNASAPIDGSQLPKPCVDRDDNRTTEAKHWHHL